MNDYMQDELKKTFAEIYKLAGALKNEIKSIDKLNDAMLYIDPVNEWERVSRQVNTIVTSAELAGRLSQQIVKRADDLLALGPYEGERAGVGPMEAMAMGAGE